MAKLVGQGPKGSTVVRTLEQLARDQADERGHQGLAQPADEERLVGHHPLEDLRVVLAGVLGQLGDVVGAGLRRIGRPEAEHPLEPRGGQPPAMQLLHQVLGDLGALVRLHPLGGGTELRLYLLGGEPLGAERLAYPVLDVAPRGAGREVLEVLGLVLIVPAARALRELLEDGLLVVLVAPLWHDRTLLRDAKTDVVQGSTTLTHALSGGTGIRTSPSTSLGGPQVRIPYGNDPG